MTFLAHGIELHVDTVWLAVVAGLFAGVAHTFMGPDHLGALMPVAVNRRFKAAWLGVRWGVGHSVGVFIVAILLLAGRETLDLTPVEAWGERLVGVMLIGLGAWGIRAAMRHRLHVHAHAHDGASHAHLHLHAVDAHDPRGGLHAHVHSHAALGAGALHGVAGMAHLLGVLPALAAPTLAISLVYLACFALGSIGSMAVFAGVFGAVTAAIGARSVSMVKGTMYVAAIGCVLIGVFWLVKPWIMPGEEPEASSPATSATGQEFQARTF